MGLAVAGVPLIATFLAKLVLTPALCLEASKYPRVVASLIGRKQTLVQKMKCGGTYVSLAGFVQNKHCVFSFFGSGCLTCGRGANSWDAGGCEAMIQSTTAQRDCRS